ncbi:MAG: glycine/betaine ABC transporter substrate-binding protein, partial [Actinobacteria bacterium]|nr:glycine/betaine ABC transporter substrate-binding protein [Actinomycetota bacterium]
LQLPQNIVPVIRQEIVDAYGEDLVSLIDSITAELTTEGLTDLNAQVEVDQEDPEEVAQAWLEEHGFLE